MRQSGTRGRRDLLEETTWTSAKGNSLGTHTFFPGPTFMFSASGFPPASAESTERTVMREVRPKASWPSGLVRRAGTALQTHSGKEGGEKDKQCQDRNKFHQYLITVVFYLRSGAAER